MVDNAVPSPRALLLSAHRPQAAPPPHSDWGSSTLLSAVDPPRSGPPRGWMRRGEVTVARERRMEGRKEGRKKGETTRKQARKRGREEERKRARKQESKAAAAPGDDGTSGEAAHRPEDHSGHPRGWTLATRAEARAVTYERLRSAAASDLCCCAHGGSEDQGHGRTRPSGRVSRDRGLGLGLGMTQGEVRHAHQGEDGGSTQYLRGASGK